MKLIQGDCLVEMRKLPDNSVDSIVVDPPYGISFMGKKWDYNIPKVEVWQEALRVLKAGGHALVACGTRTQHRMAVNLEDAGFEIRDIVAWVYGSGFPKSLNIGKAVDKMQGNERTKYLKPIAYKDSDCWGKPNSNSKGNDIGFETQGTGNRKDMDGKGNQIKTKGTSKYEGWGTALKPAMELWTLCRKPLSEKTVAKNVLKYGTGGINIDGCRVGTGGGTKRSCQSEYPKKENGKEDRELQNWRTGHEVKELNKGRFPANLIHDGSDEVVGLFPDTKSGKMGANNTRHTDGSPNGIYGKFDINHPLGETYGDSGSASRFFYCAKASKSERNKGLDSYVTVKYIVPKIDRGAKKWKEEIMVAVQLLKRVISDMAHMSFSIGECGESIMAQCHKDSLSTTLMEINKIIELKILNLLMHSLTNESTLDANSLMGNGGNLAGNAENLKRYLLTITKDNLELALGASNVVLKMLSLISEEENWKQATNFHSTVKPIALMRYLCRLITPKGGTILDPFMGSGSTGIGAKLENFNFIGIELDEDYFNIAKSRIENYIVQTELFKEEK